MMAAKTKKAPGAGNAEGQAKNIDAPSVAHPIDHAHRMGWRLIPIEGKAPRLKNWPNHAGLSPDAARARLANGANLGVLCGERSGRLFVVDVDGDTLPDGLPATPTVQTGGGGWHLYYRLPDGVDIPHANKCGHVAEGVDIRWTGGQCVYPGSVHPETGAIYEFADGKSPDDLPVAEVPGWIIGALQAPKELAQTAPKPANGTASVSTPTRYLDAALQSAGEAVRTAPEGQRNATLNTEAHSLGGLLHLGLNRATVEAELLAAAIHAGLAEGEARATIRSGLESGAERPREIPERPQVPATGTKASETPEVDPLSDAAAALRLARLADGDLLHATDRGWLCWDGKRFAPDEKRARNLALKVGEITRREGHAVTNDPDLIKAFYRAAKRAESAPGIEATLKIAATLDGVNADGIEFDADPWALNCSNGTVNLKTGQLRPHRREDRNTKLCPHRFDPAATCPRWLQFLDEVFEGDAQIVEWMQWLCGYTATGATHRHIMPILHGSGRNGKSVLIKALRHVLGRDYAVSVDPEDLMVKHGGGHNHSIPRLRGARFAWAQETAENRRIDEPLIKLLTGDDPITGRELYGKLFEFNPTHTLWMATNYKPRITGTAPAIWDRLRFVPFERRFEPHEQDRDLDAKLAREATGILAWCVTGARMGEPLIPERVKEATDTYREESDVLGEFIEEYLAELEHTKPLLKRDVYEAYRKERNNHCEGFKEFNKKLESRGFESVKNENGHCWKGVAFRAKYATYDLA